ncbi:MAG: BON domain-containing protein [Bryobacteraceae bacterium]|jgi:hyperosmotically inducible periplasmic protein|nr:BON domain-containing protein [Solibacteraceae bacterium]MCL4841813.1 BON domain-containing protein [Bryobacteraceae bacterium]MCO5352982.1 BON domain-containing protein [Bryobacteraceae bacterium]HRJ20750.1 BON domain-containing protein [Bryobacteraceae bacterium]
MRHLAILLAFLLLGVCAGAAVLQEVTADDRIYDEVIRRLADDRDIKGNAFDITVKEGVVTVKGTVTRDKHRQKAEKIIKKVKGVKQVVNELVIKEF